MITNNSALVIPPPSAGTLTNDIRGIRPPVEIPNTWAWVWWTLAAMAFAAVLAAVIIWWRRRQLLPPLLPPVPAHVRAKQKLQAALSLLGDPKAFCTAVSDTIRCYLEERFDFRAPERTTEEFLLELQATTRLTPDQKQSLGDFLQSCDLVKFARFEPTEAALREIHESALRLVDETQFEPLPTAPPAGINSDSSGTPPVIPPSLVTSPGETATAASQNSPSE